MRRLIVLLAAAAGIAASAAFGSTSSTSGLHGVVRRGPITPICVAGQRCDAPARHFTLLFSRNGRVAGRTTTNARGRYRIRLAPGRYAVRIGRGGRFKRPDPDVARVKAGVLIRVAFHLDTGIR